MKFSIITPAFNRADLTYNFLTQHWIQYQSNSAVEWIIIDNGSTDPTNGALMTSGIAMRERLIVITNQANEGFSRASNQGAVAASGDILVFVNNDVIVKADYLGPIGDALSNNPTALVGARLFDFDTGWNKFGDEVITYLAGWCLAMRAETFEDLGGFDERYSPADYEDIDLCHAATQAGQSLIPLTLPVYHMDSQTARSYLPNRREITERNRVKFIEKWRLS